jgi:hypothetical protein
MHRDGRAQFGDWGVGGSKFALFPLNSRIEFASDGVPTKASLQAIAKEVAGLRGQDPSTVDLAYFKTSETETIMLDSWLKQMFEASQNNQLSPYKLFGNNCRDYCLTGLNLSQSSSHHAGELGGWSLIPNLFIDQLGWYADATYSQRTQERNVKQREKKPDVSSTICYEGQPGCKVQQ